MIRTYASRGPNRSSISSAGLVLVAAGFLSIAIRPLSASAQDVQAQVVLASESAPFLVEASVPYTSAEEADNRGLTAEQSSSAPQSTTPTATQQPNLPDAPKPSDENSNDEKKDCKILPCPTPIINWYMRFQNGPQVKPLTPKEKAWLATRNLLDPFNLAIIGLTSGISVAADSHSPYGPGWPGFGRNVGVSFTEDMTAEFFGTFLIPSIVHQDPHYHRMPHARYPRRIFHAIAQVAWTQGDDGKGMLNYANFVGLAIDDEIANLYVPGRQTNSSATAQRYAIGLATSPIDNFLIEFLPDVAKRIHVQVVVVQRIINHVASKDQGGF